MANVELSQNYSWLYGLHHSSIFNKLQFLM
jgi:hypothetical protein